AEPGRARELLRAQLYAGRARSVVSGRDDIGAGHGGTGRMREARPVSPIRAFPAVLALLAALATAPVACAAGAFAPTRVDGGAGSRTAIAEWQIQENARAQQSGAEVSSAGYATHDWYPVSGRATVMAGLLESGTYKNVFYSDNLRTVQPPGSSGDLFVVPWWYRTEFTVPNGAQGIRTLLRIN